MPIARYVVQLWNDHIVRAFGGKDAGPGPHKDMTVASFVPAHTVTGHNVIGNREERSWEEPPSLVVSSSVFHATKRVHRERVRQLRDEDIPALDFYDSRIAASRAEIRALEESRQHFLKEVAFPNAKVVPEDTWSDVFRKQEGGKAK
jgi:hypothetical protein